MKHLRFSLCLLALLLSLTCFIPSALAANTYEDEEIGISFTIPEGWVENDSLAGAEAKAVFVYDQSCLITYSCVDLWEQASAYEKSGVKRSDVDNDNVSIDDVFGDSAFLSGEKSKKNIGNYEYFYWDGMLFKDKTCFDSILAIHVSDGYAIGFNCVAPSITDSTKEDFLKLIASADFSSLDTLAASASVSPTAEPTYEPPRFTSSYIPASSRPPAFNFTVEGFILDLIVTVAVYSLPIIIYRYGIRKRPMEKNAAKKLTIIYGIAAFIVMALVVAVYGESGEVVGGAIFFWSAINYTMLIKGKDTRGINEMNPSPASRSGEPAGETTYIVMLCGAEGSPRATGVNLPDICRRLELSVLGASEDGSVVVTTEKTESALRMSIGAKILETCGRDVPVVIRPLSELEQTLNACPFPKESTEGDRLYLAMAMISVYAHIGAIKDVLSDGDEVRGLVRDIYVYTRNGLTWNLLEVLEDMGAAVCSWETVKGIVALAKMTTQQAQESRTRIIMTDTGTSSKPSGNGAAAFTEAPAPEKPENAQRWHIGPEEDEMERRDGKETGYDKGDERTRLRDNEEKRRRNDPHNYWKGN